jgi:hypothetical protein
MAGEEDWRSKLSLPAKDLRIRTEVRRGRGGGLINALSRAPSRGLAAPRGR